MAGVVLGPDGVPFANAGGEEALRLNEHGSLRVVQSMPDLAELTKFGNSWQVKSATGLAALTALPTTVAGLSLYNGEAQGSTRCLVIDSFGSSEEVIDATQTDNTAIYASLNPTPQTAPTATALTFRSLSGKASGYAGLARAVAALTVVNSGWFPHATPGASMAAAVAGANFKINEVIRPGLYIVPPGAIFNVQAVKAGAAAAAQQFFFVRWHEVRLALAA